MAKIVNYANGASKDVRDNARKELLKEFTTFYTTKTLQSLEGMHVFDKNGYSLLRFHKVKKHDDSIIELRESLQNMSKEHLYQKGIEIGVYKESYRFQYPLFYDGEFVGSYEYSASFDALQKEMRKFFGEQYVLLLKACEVDRVSAKTAKQMRYRKYSFKEKSYYYQEKLFESKKDIDNFEHILGSQRVHDLINSNLAGVVDFTLDGRRYDIIVKPLVDISQKDIGHIVAISNNSYLDDLDNDLLIDIFLATLLSLSIFVYMLKQIRHKNYVRELINIQKDMLIVTDGTGIKDANNTMLEFFGYKSLKEFHQEHLCICDFFIKEDDFLQEKMDGKHWIDYILQNKDKEHRVKIKDRRNNKDKVFNIEYKSLKSTGSVFIVFKDITEEYEEVIRLKNRANYDSLTQIYNRASFEYYLDNQIKKSTRSRSVFSLIMFDIDHFKNINDTHGHDAGDIILKELTSLVSSHIRQSDIFARWGGEEFMIISMSNLDHAETLAEKIRQIIEDYEFSVVGKITCSFGVTQYHKDDTKESLVKRSDNMLYSAKENGRNSVVSIR
jgi:diguanylate cyclase (GGDEF)-like protein